VSEDTFRCDDSKTCPDCYGPVRDMQFDGRCFTCGTGKPPEPDPEAIREAHRATARMLRIRSYQVHGVERRLCEQDAAHFERLAARG